MYDTVLLLAVLIFPEIGYKAMKDLIAITCQRSRVPPNIFRRRFLMSHSLFIRIQSAVEAHEDGLSSLQKVTAAMRMVAYGAIADSVEYYVRIGESTTIETWRRFVKAVVAIFSDEYLRSPNENDIVRLLEVGKGRGFSRILESIDCMHWKWKNCPTTWSRIYIGHIHELTILSEVVASYDLWIWHAFFGLLGSLNNINVLKRSTMFNELAEGCAPNVNYTINGYDYTMDYYLVDSIYLSWSRFVKIIPSPQGNKRKLFAATQESARKDVKHAFGVLQD